MRPAAAALLAAALLPAAARFGHRAPVGCDGCVFDDLVVAHAGQPAAPVPGDGLLTTAGAGWLPARRWCAGARGRARTATPLQRPCAMLQREMVAPPLPPADASAPRRSAASALLTLWLDDQGAWHASIVLPDGCRLAFDSPFELARWSRVAVPPSARLPGNGLR